MTEIELLIRKNALKEVELWLYEQYAEIDKELMQLTEDRNDDSALHEVEIDN
jgi:hypothetical protein